MLPETVTVNKGRIQQNSNACTAHTHTHTHRWISLKSPRESKKNYISQVY